jgi:hypothetical protein
MEQTVLRGALLRNMLLVLFGLPPSPPQAPMPSLLSEVTTLLLLLLYEPACKASGPRMARMLSSTVQAELFEATGR